MKLGILHFAEVNLTMPLITLRRLNIGTIIGNQLGVQMLNDIKKNVDKFLFEDDIKTSFLTIRRCHVCTAT